MIRLLVGCFVVALCSVPLEAWARCKTGEPHKLVALATYYHLPGLPMANGEKFNPRDTTIAAVHQKFLPLGTRLRIKNPENNIHLNVKVVDRMPVKKTRTPRIDLTHLAAKHLGFATQGIICVELEIISTPMRRTSLS